MNSVTKTMHLFEEGDQRWYSVYRTIGLEGRPIEAIVPREERSPLRVLGHLLNAGADLSLDEATKTAIEAAIAANTPTAHRAGQTGWRANQRCFVSLLTVGGRSQDGSTIYRPKNAASSAGARLTRQGTLEGWQNLVAVARHSTIMTVCLCASFAAPLLSLLNRPSFGVMVYGPTRCGKSTSQLVGASSLGFGIEEDLPTLNATPAGLLNLGLSFGDHALFLNEVGTARGGKKQVPAVLFESTYALMSGRDVTRHPSWSAANAGGTGTFRILPVLSSEFSPDEWAVRGGIERDPGEVARMIGLSALLAGSTHIFDQLPPEALADPDRWVRQQFKLLKDGLPLHHGVAFCEFVTALTHNTAGIRKTAEQRVAQFQASVDHRAGDDIGRDIVAKFGVLWAGGLAAVDAGILALDRKLLSLAIKRACLAALADRPNPARELRDDLTSLAGQLDGGSIIDVTSPSRRDISLLSKADGTREKQEHGWEYLIRTESFRKWVYQPARRRRLLDHLDDGGYLRHQRPRTPGISEHWAQRQRTWRDGTRQRSICIFLPHGAADLHTE